VYDSEDYEPPEQDMKAPIFPMFREMENPSLPTLSAPEKYPVHNSGMKFLNSAIDGHLWSTPVLIFSIYYFLVLTHSASSL
jgi:hypothetical protein